MKRLIIICIYIIMLSVELYSISIYSYTNGDEKIKVEDTQMNHFSEMLTYLETTYNVTLHTKQLYLSDEFGNNISIWNINIITNKELYEIFNGAMHSSPLIENIAYNLLQPLASRDDWSIDTIIISLNGIYLEYLLNDLVYSTVMNWYMFLGKSFEEVKYYNR